MPRWLFVSWDVIQFGDDPEFDIYATMRVPDRDTGDMVPINYKITISPPQNEDEVLLAGRRLLYYLAKHEVNEHLLLDGKRWVDTHIEGDPPGAEI